MCKQQNLPSPTSCGVKGREASRPVTHAACPSQDAGVVPGALALLVGHSPAWPSFSACLSSPGELQPLQPFPSPTATFQGRKGALAPMGLSEQTLSQKPPADVYCVLCCDDRSLRSVWIQWRLCGRSKRDGRWVVSSTGRPLSLGP